jgi:hypothetical protein
VPEDTDAAACGQPLQPRRDVDAVAVNVAAAGDHVAENLSAPNELGAGQLPACCRPKASSILADRVPLEDHAVARDRFAEKPLLATSKAHSKIARLVNGIAVDARALGSDLTALTSA